MVGMGRCAAIGRPFLFADNFLESLKLLPDEYISVALGLHGLHRKAIRAQIFETFQRSDDRLSFIAISTRRSIGRFRSQSQ